MGFFDFLLGSSGKRELERDIEKHMSERDVAAGLIHDRAQALYESTGHPGKAWVNDTISDVEDFISLYGKMEKYSNQYTDSPQDYSETVIEYIQSHMDNCDYVMTQVYPGDGMYNESERMKIKLDETLNKYLKTRK